MGLIVNGETPERVTYSQGGSYKGEAATVTYAGTVIWPHQTSPFLCTKSGTYYFPTNSLSYTAVGGGGPGGTRTGAMSSDQSHHRTVLSAPGNATVTVNAGKSGNGKTGAAGAAGSPGGKSGGSGQSRNGGNGGAGRTFPTGPTVSGGDGFYRIDRYPNQGGRGTLIKASSGGAGYGGGGGGYGASTIHFSGSYGGSLDSFRSSGGGGSGAVKTGTLTGTSGVIAVTVQVGQGQAAGSVYPGVNSGQGAPGAVYFTW